MDKIVVDELGLVKANNFLALYIPATAKALIFRVKARVNSGCEVLDYGPIPLKTGDTLNSFDVGTVSVPEDGVIPARSYTPKGYLYPPIISGTWDTTDMWFYPSDWAERLFHIIAEWTPRLMRVGLELPIGTKQTAFQQERIDLDINSPFGWARGKLEIAQLPALHYGYLFANETSAAFYTHTRFTYAEYIVDIPHDPETIFNIINYRTPAYWITMPIRKTYEAKIETALKEAYGYEGFPIYGVDQHSMAIAEYKKILEGVKL
jgi:hypothetical protein